MSTHPEESKQPVIGVAAKQILDGPNHDPRVPLPTPAPNCDPRVLLPTPGDSPVPWHLLRPIEPLSVQENIMQAAMILEEPRYIWSIWQPKDPLKMQEAIVQLAEAIRHCEKTNDVKINDDNINVNVKDNDKNVDVK